MNLVTELMKSHVSVRAFLDDPIPEESLIKIIEAGQSASTSSHIQAYSVIRVTDPAKRQTISEAAGGQRWVNSAPEFLVFCADLRRLNYACLKAGMGELDGITEHSLAASIDAALFAQNVLLAAESLEFGGVFIGGIRNAPDKVIAQLELPEFVFPLFGMCLGIPKNKNELKPRLPINAVLHTDTYDLDKIPSSVDDFDEMMSQYYLNRDPSSTTNWSESVAVALQQKKREHMLSCLQETGFFRS
ncbi:MULTISPECIES: oxygen-insensitive NADPH nitroreductase [unclassified Marinobacterium]|jgi:nitroreductase|uniref:oxygen-insensitive NADPH nitroreductase n=1 Tax=unclassified Marinobacterium TaxID=2644139 RepID=UPI001569CB22|nr:MULTISPECIES: oxygen-insensitive NADPH nitroreductase [unclassified Marinobacterium]NRP27464.1 FMN reductase (NADPH) [Marinobacterium sp. xm-d-420]NRP52381.1 FMN reductase (NADPH) [Marinobacterium sp. xm-v-242]NRP76962.1 FMN reductase (NADPH) [Marinobacterium sp. xm-m-383]